MFMNPNYASQFPSLPRGNNIYEAQCNHRHVNTTNRHFIMWYRVEEINRVNKQKNILLRPQMKLKGNQNCTTTIQHDNMKFTALSRVAEEMKHKTKATQNIVADAESFVCWSSSSSSASLDLCFFADIQKLIVNSSYRCQPCGYERGLPWKKDRPGNGATTSKQRLSKKAFGLLRSSSFIPLFNLMFYDDLPFSESVSPLLSQKGNKNNGNHHYLLRREDWLVDEEFFWGLRNERVLCSLESEGIIRLKSGGHSAS